MRVKMVHRCVNFRVEPVAARASLTLSGMVSIRVILASDSRLFSRVWALCIGVFNLFSLKLQLTDQLSPLEGFGVHEFGKHVWRHVGHRRAFFRQFFDRLWL